MVSKSKILNHSAIKERTGRVHDPRHIFYHAMLACDTYEAYSRRGGGMTVEPATSSYAVTGEMRSKHVRNDRHWIADA